MTAKKKEITLRQLALELGMSLEIIRNVLKELPGTVSRETQDRIYKTARKLGYDFRKLKIGKRMQYRKEMLDERWEINHVTLQFEVAPGEALACEQSPNGQCGPAAPESHHGHSH